MGALANPRSSCATPARGPKPKKRPEGGSAPSAHRSQRRLDLVVDLAPTRCSSTARWREGSSPSTRGSPCRRCRAAAPRLSPSGKHALFLGELCGVTWLPGESRGTSAGQVVSTVAPGTGRQLSRRDCGHSTNGKFAYATKPREKQHRMFAVHDEGGASSSWHSDHRGNWRPLGSARRALDVHFEPAIRHVTGSRANAESGR